MLTDVGQLLSIDAEHGGVHHRVEVGDDAAVHSIAQTVILCVHNGGQSIEAVQEGQCAGIQPSFISRMKGTSLSTISKGPWKNSPLWKEPELTHCISIIRQMEVE